LTRNGEKQERGRAGNGNHLGQQGSILLHDFVSSRFSCAIKTSAI
jgi:hypothetical protein